MGFNNSVYNGELLSNSPLLAGESVYIGPIDTSRDLRITLQLDSTVNNADNPPPNPTQKFTVEIFNIAYTDVQDNIAFQQRTTTVIGTRGIGSVRFDVVGFNKVRVKIRNENDFGVYLTVRLTEARME